MKRLGYVGKTPHRGDFVRYNLPTMLLGVWDDWLVETLRATENDAEDWSARYDGAAPWRFALSPGIAGDDGWAGVLLPSRDGVGRRYPFALIGALEGNVTPIECLARDTVLDALDALARRAIADASIYEGLRDALGALQDSLAKAADEAEAAADAPFRAGTVDGTEEPAVFAEDSDLLTDRRGTARLLDAVLRQSVGQYSLWQRRPDGGGSEGGLVVSGGLPRGAGALVLFGSGWAPEAGGRLDGTARTDTRPRRDGACASAVASPAVAGATDADASPGTKGTASVPPDAAPRAPDAAASPDVPAEPAADGSGDGIEPAAPESGPRAMPEGADTAASAPADHASDTADAGAMADVTGTDDERSDPPDHAPPVAETLRIDDEGDDDAPWDLP